MELEDKYVTVNEMQALMAANKLKPYTGVWIRTLCGSGDIKSRKIFNSLVIPRSEVTRVIGECKARAKKNESL